MINILLNSRDIFSKYIFQKINDLCIDENDFYHKEKSLKFILYSKFINKCQNLYNKFKNIKGIYPNSIKKINEKILKDLTNGNIKFEILRSSMIDD